jgi:hypothetical protein
MKKESAMKPGLVKKYEKVNILKDFECSKSDLHISANACGIDYTDSQLLKRACCLPKSQGTYHRTTYHSFEDTVEFTTGVG